MNAAPEIPDEVIHIIDDNEARKFLTECELLGPLERDCAATDGTAAAMGLHHPTHWILAVHYMGNPLPADNGFQVFAWPKSQFRREVLDGQLRQMKLHPTQANWRKDYRAGDPTGLQ